MSTPLPLLEPQKTQQPADPSRAEHKQENKKNFKNKIHVMNVYVSRVSSGTKRFFNIQFFLSLKNSTLVRFQLGPKQTLEYLLKNK